MTSSKHLRARGAKDCIDATERPLLVLRRVLVRDAYKQ
jgi:hypothetical protein